MNDKTKRPFLTHASGAPVTDKVSILTAKARPYDRVENDRPVIRHKVAVLNEVADRDLHPSCCWS